ncbi:maker162 [Drosophila busckii]|uniref:Maker162 n=2 Tax=Drosophila busckii TaxID=30019 RepID=A0A0M4EH11_DROBS|nr:maker162 [Drosophila busckii]
MRQAELNPEGYVSNILHSLPMMRRMHQDAPKIIELVKFDAGAELDGIHGYRLNIINKMEFDHAVNGLLRVQNTYDLEAEHMANGLLGLKQYNATLNSLDCLALARHLAEQDNRELASNWYQLALDKYEQTSQSLYQLLNIKRADILKELNALKKSR